MTPERIDRTNDERLYQPPIHSRWIRHLHQLSEELGEPMTVLVDRAISEYVEQYQLGREDEKAKQNHNAV
jgi:hypothetical protein